MTANQGQNHAPQTWQESVLVPLTQNIIGGLAASGIAAIAGYLFITDNIRTVAEIGAISGVLVACSFTVVRFFGDDLNLIQRAFRAGQASMVPQIERLQNQIHDADSQVEQLTIKKEKAPLARDSQEMMQAINDAEKIIRWGFSSHSVSRAACANRGIPQRRWERAKQAIERAGIHTDGWVAKSQTATIAALRAHYQN